MTEIDRLVSAFLQAYAQCKPPKSQLELLINKRVTLWCANYIYTGKLVGVTDVATLEDAAVVYETGPLKDKTWKDSQELPHPWNVRLDAVESYGVLK